MTKEINETCLENNDTCDMTIDDRITKINLESFDGRHKHIRKSQFTVYTDGSKTADGVGAGFVIYRHNCRIHTESFNLNRESTVFQAEIEAIFQATQYLIAHTHDLGIQYVKILSDSQNAIKALSNRRIKSKGVLKALESMASIVSSLTLSLIKAHVGTEGNEEADKAAKEGTIQGQHITNIKTKGSWGLVKNTIKRHTDAIWYEDWNKEDRFKHTKLFYTQPSNAKSRGILQLGTANLKKWIECITGHNNLSYFQNKLDATVDPTCRLCGNGVETVEHFIINCDYLHNRKRELLLGKEMGTCMDWSIKNIRKFLDIKEIDDLIHGKIDLKSKELIYQDYNYSDDSSSS